MMRKILLLILLILFPAGFQLTGIRYSQEALPDESRIVYDDMGLAGIVSYTAFDQAYEGYRKIEGRRKSVLTLIDYSKPSTQQRLYVFDMAARRLLHISHVAHGRGSGGNYATSFSNVPGSHQSSLGFFLTEGTYIGRNGYSLILEGLEKNINDRARERAIVIHGADYCAPVVAASAGRLGRSFGCPALPREVNREIINTIKGGSVIYIYADNAEYRRMTTIIRPRTELIAQARIPAR